jgi:hypothetical protein
VVAELEPSLLLHAATASAAIMIVAMVLVDFTGLSAIQMRSSSGGRCPTLLQNDYRIGRHTDVTVVSPPVR